MGKGRIDIKYIDEINAFHSWLQVNDLPASAILLWYSLMHFCNRTGWKRKFNLALAALEADTHLGATTIQRARERLEAAGLIIVIHRSGRQSALYQLTPISKILAGRFEQQNEVAIQNEQLNGQLSEQQNEVAVQNEQLNGQLSEQQNEVAVQNEQLNGQLSEHIPRHRHRHIYKTKDAGEPDETKIAIESYQNKIHPLQSGIEADMLQSLVDEYGPGMCIKAIDRAVLRKKRTIKYIAGILRRWQQDGYDEADGSSPRQDQDIPEEIKNIPF